MKFPILLTLFTLALSQNLQHQPHLDTSLKVLTLTPGTKCHARPIYRTVACLCFLAFEKKLITPSLRTSCKTLFNRAARNLSSRCSTFVRNGSLRPFRAVAAARRFQAKCFVDAPVLDIPPGSEVPGGRGGVPIQQILEQLDQVKATLDEALGVLDVMLILPSTPARVVVVGRHQKVMRLAAYNDIPDKTL